MCKGVKSLKKLCALGTMVDDNKGLIPIYRAWKGVNIVNGRVSSPIFRGTIDRSWKKASKNKNFDEGFHGWGVYESPLRVITNICARAYVRVLVAGPVKRGKAYAFKWIRLDC